MKQKKYNFDKPFVGFDGKPIIEQGETVHIGERLSFFLFSISTLNSQMMGQEQKYQAYKLMRKLQKGGEVELTEEEKTLVKQVAAETFSVGAYGQIVEILGE